MGRSKDLRTGTIAKYAMVDFTFILLGKRYVVRASDFWAATGYMNGVRDGWCAHLRWIPSGVLNTYVLGNS